jgi:hypothetical protein
MSFDEFVLYHKEALVLFAQIFAVLTMLRLAQFLIGFLYTFLKLAFKANEKNVQTSSSFKLLKKYDQPCDTFIQEMNEYFNAHSELDQVYRRI